jgi:hypothetical protein
VLDRAALNLTLKRQPSAPTTEGDTPPPAQPAPAAQQTSTVPALTAGNQSGLAATLEGIIAKVRAKNIALEDNPPEVDSSLAPYLERLMENSEGKRYTKEAQELVDQLIALVKLVMGSD